MAPLRSGPGVGTAPGLRRARAAALRSTTRAGTAGVDQAFLEQRVVNPDLTDSDTPATASIAAGGGGERMMSCPGMGGYPLGPTQQSAPQPGRAAVVRSTDRTSLQGSRAPAGAVPGAPAVTGPSVIEACSVEVRSLTGALLSGGTGGGTPHSTFAAPTATVGPNGIVLSGPSGTETYYPTDGSDPRVADLPSNTATHCTAPVVITAPDTVLTFVAFDADGNFRDTGTFGLVAAAGPAAPTGVATTLVATRLTHGVDHDITVTGHANMVTGAASNPAVTVRPVASTVDRLTSASARWKVGPFTVPNG